MIHVAGTVALLIAALAFLGFVIAYGILADWRSSPWGRAIMRFHAGWAAILLYVVLASWGIRFPKEYNDWVRLVIYGVVAYLGIQQLYLMVREQLLARDRQRRGKR